MVEVEDAVGRLGSVDTAQEFDISVGIGAGGHRGGARREVVGNSGE